ncbi:MAG: hypothetical protein GEU83_21270 [Pseudonocardiaceae bacterium]|nr:hypothetical protein [Pseudonocardiaceae bacterium]
MNAPRPEPGCPHRELAVGWALHCLEPAEESLFAAHLPSCADCRQTVQDAEEVGAALALTVPDAAPPESLQHRILGNAHTDVDHTDVDHTVGEGSRRGDVTPLHRRTPSRPPGRTMGRELAAAAVVALVAVAGVLGIRVTQLDTERDRVAQQLTDMSQLVERMAGPDARPVTLADTDGRPKAMLVAEPGRVTLLPMDLPSNSASQTYVLWGIGTGAPVALDAFDVATDSTVAHTADSPTRAEAFSAFAVSIEQGRTAPAAPSDVLAKGEVDS